MPLPIVCAQSGNLLVRNHYIEAKTVFVKNKTGKEITELQCWISSLATYLTTIVYFHESFAPHPQKS